MPERRRVADAAMKAETMDAGSGPSAEPLNLATVGVPEVVNRLVKMLGLDDYLGVGAGSQRESEEAKLPMLPPSDLRMKELLDNQANGSRLHPDAKAAFDLQQAKMGGREMPVTPNSPTGSKPLTEYLGDVLTPANRQRGMPSRVRLTSVNPESGEAITHALDQGYTQMNASVGDMAKLIKEGHLVPEGPAEQGVTQLMTKLRSLMSSAGKVARR